jgi:hypothetical protein
MRRILGRPCQGVKPLLTVQWAVALSRLAIGG